MTEHEIVYTIKWENGGDDKGYLEVKHKNDDKEKVILCRHERMDCFPIVWNHIQDLIHKSVEKDLKDIKTEMGVV